MDELYANVPYQGEPSQGWLYLQGRVGSRYISIVIEGVKDPWTHIDRFLHDLAQQEDA